MTKKRTALALIFITFTALFTGSSALAVETNVNLSAIASGMSLTLTTSGTGTGTITRDDPGPYALNDVVTLTAVPDPNNRFTGWTGDVVGIEETVTVTLDSAKSVNAEFTMNIVSFSLSTNSLDFGDVTLGTASTPIVIDMTNTGNVDLQWSVSITETGSFYTDYLMANGGVKVTTLSSSIMGSGVGDTWPTSYYLDLTQAPDSVVDSVAHEGTLVYWAEASG